MFNDVNVGLFIKIVLWEVDWLKKMNDMIGLLGVNKIRYFVVFFFYNDIVIY